MRPVYETGRDLKKEQAVASIFKSRWNMDMHKTAKFYPVDFLLYSDKYKRWMLVEVKCRNIRWGEYPDIILSHEKVSQVLPHLHTGLGFMFVVAALDKIGIFTMLSGSRIAEYSINMSGRMDRGDKADIELCHHIPTSEFKCIELTSSEKDSIWGIKQ
jgi:hypothetical protein